MGPFHEPPALITTMKLRYGSSDTRGNANEPQEAGGEGGMGEALVHGMHKKLFLHETHYNYGDLATISLHACA